VLENNYAKFVFDSEIKNFIEIENKTTGDNILKKVFPGCLFQIVGLHTNHNERCFYSPGKFFSARKKSADCGDCLEIKFSSIVSKSDEIDVSVIIEVSLVDHQPESLWKIEVDNQTTNIDIVEVVFPYIRGVFLGDSWEDDVIIYPHHAGEKTKQPIQAYTSPHFAEFFRAEVKKEADFYAREINYCGLASMMWMYYYDAGNGFYFGSHDDDFLVTGIRAETGGVNDPWMGFAFRKYYRILPGDRWQSNNYVLALTDQDWHWGAERYRKWFMDCVEISPQPDYLANECTLNQCYQLKRQGVVANRFDDIPKIYETGKELFNARHIFLASWNRSGFDRDYPEFQPDIELGTPLDLAQAVRDVRIQGGMVTFYINARIFHKDSDFFKTLGHKWGLKTYEGDLIIEQYGPEVFSVSCPAHVEWQKMIIDLAEWMIRAYGANGIYLDQLGSAEPFPCFDSQHSHDGIGEFNLGYLSVLRDINKRIKQIDPNSYLMIENCGDIYSAHVWSNLTWNGPDYDEFYNVYKYTFPEFQQVHMVNPKGNLELDDRWRKFYFQMSRALLLGAVLWLGVDKFEDSNHKEFLEFTSKAVRLREALNPIIAEARFFDDRGIVDIPEGIEATHWQLNNGDHLFIISNCSLLHKKYFDVRIPSFNLEAVSSDCIDQLTNVVKYEKLDNDILRIRVPDQRISFVTFKAKGG
jgi:hypothetical protein